MIPKITAHGFHIPQIDVSYLSEDLTKNKRVRISETPPTVRFVESFKDSSEKELLWWRKEDYEQFLINSAHFYAQKIHQNRQQNPSTTLLKPRYTRVSSIEIHSRVHIPLKNLKMSPTSNDPNMLFKAKAGVDCVQPSVSLCSKIPRCIQYERPHDSIQFLPQRNSTNYIEQMGQPILDFRPPKREIDRARLPLKKRLKTDQTTPTSSRRHYVQRKFFSMPSLSNIIVPVVVS